MADDARNESTRAVTPVFGEKKARFFEMPRVRNVGEVGKRR
jgi:hypothetical protein